MKKKAVPERIGEPEKEVPQVQRPVVDNVNAPEIYTSECVGFFNASGNITLTFVSARATHTNPGRINKVISARVVLPVAAAQTLAINLYDFLKKQGIEPKFPGEPGQTPPKTIQ